MVVARHDTLQAILVQLTPDKTLSHGLHLRMDKCSVWWPTAPLQQQRDAYPPSLRQNFGSPGTVLLQAPLGTGAFVAEYLQTTRDRLDPLF